MLPISSKHCCLAVTTIILVGLLSTADADADPLPYGSTFSVANTFQFTEMDVLPNRDGAAMAMVALSDPSNWREGGFDRLTDLSALESYALVYGGGAQISSVANNLAPTGVTLLQQNLPVGLTSFSKVVTLFSRGAPQPSALILLGSALLVLAIIIRRITAQKNPDIRSRRDSTEPNLSVSAEPEADYDKLEIGDPVAPLFRQNASGRTDSIPVSEPS